MFIHSIILLIHCLKEGERMRLKIVKMGINGEGIAYQNRIPIFIPGALIDEEIEAKITFKSERYMKAELLRIIKTSPYRIEAKCRHQSSCGGCPLMIAEIPQQLRWKENHLKQTLIKYAQINPQLIEPIQENPYPFSYRNQCKLPIVKRKGKLVCGLYEENSNHLIPIKKCIIHDELLENCRKEIIDICNRYHLPDFSDGKGLRTLVLRAMNEKIQVTFVSGKMNLPTQFIEDILNINQVVSVVQNINTNRKSREIFGKETVYLAGNEKLEFNIEGLKLQLSPNSFFQLNTIQSFAMFNKLKEFIKTGSLMVEAYCGVGTISLLLHEYFDEIIGIEIIKEAIENAKVNALNNQVKNCRFICGDSANECKKIVSKKEIDCLIVDPPRSGLDDKMIHMIRSAKIKQIFYISCNPSTLAKNLSQLKNEYEVERIIPYDMFTHTPHIETIVILSCKK